MRIDRVRIHNYRSIRDVEFTTEDLVVLLGPNNHGKSNVLGALEFGLSTSAKVTKDDVCAFCEEQEPEIWVELTFADLEEQELRTFERYVRSDGTVKIRKTARLDADGSAEIGYRGYLEQPDNWWLQAGATDRLGSQDAVRREAQDLPELETLLEDGGRITKQRIYDFQKAYIGQHREELSFSEVLEDGPLLGTKNVAGGVLPDLYIIPAVRDL